jgi:hypothetical protein
MPVPITREAILSYKGVVRTNRETARLTIAAMGKLQALSFDLRFESRIPGQGVYWQGCRKLGDRISSEVVSVADVRFARKNIVPEVSQLVPGNRGVNGNKREQKRRLRRAVERQRGTPAYGQHFL